MSIPVLKSFKKKKKNNTEFNWENTIYIYIYVVLKNLNITGKTP